MQVEVVGIERTYSSIDTTQDSMRLGIHRYDMRSTHIPTLMPLPVIP